MNINEVYNHIAKHDKKRVVLQFTNQYLPSAKQIESEFLEKFPNTKFFISADK